jgi:hypothetical protein
MAQFKKEYRSSQERHGDWTKIDPQECTRGSAMQKLTVIHQPLVK